MDGGEEGAGGNRGEYEEFRKSLEQGLKPVLLLGEPENRWIQSGLLILSARGYRLEARPKFRERPASLPVSGQAEGWAWNEFGKFKEEYHGYCDDCD